jgi:N-methylhydantoinase A
LAGDFSLNSEKARRIYKLKVADVLNRDLVEAAYGVYEIANSNIRRAITSVSSERGRDPRKFSLFVFGGAGALHGAAVARSIGMKEVIIAPLAGIFSAYGLLCADIQRNYVRAYDGELESGVLRGVNGVFEDMVKEALHTANQHGAPKSGVKIEKYADLRYRRQQSELTIPLPAGDVEPHHLESLHEEFHKEYEMTFGFRLANSPIDIVNLRVSSTITISKPTAVMLGTNGTGHAKRVPTTRRALFGAKESALEVPVVGMEEITSRGRPGPVFIDTYDSTIVVPPASHIHRSTNGNLVIALE